MPKVEWCSRCAWRTQHVNGSCLECDPRPARDPELEKAGQPTLDLFAAREARDEALDRVEANAPSDWKARAQEAVRRVCASRSAFIVDDVWTELDHETPPEPRAMGAVMRWARNEGLCEETESYRPSARPTSHGNPRVVWASRIYQEAA